MSTAIIMIAPDGEVVLGWDLIKSTATTPTDTYTVDATTIWCRALVAARSAALEEAAKVAETMDYLVVDLGPPAEHKVCSGICTVDGRDKGTPDRIAAAIREMKGQAATK